MTQPPAPAFGARLSNPAAFAANLSATCDRLRNPDQLRRTHVAHTAPEGVKPAEAPIAPWMKVQWQVVTVSVLELSAQGSSISVASSKTSLATAPFPQLL